MDVLETVRVQGRRLEAVEHELDRLHRRLARLEGIPEAPPQARPQPTPRRADWRDPASWAPPA
nr:hypothetical protein [Actinomycetota bacterium]